MLGKWLIGQVGKMVNRAGWENYKNNAGWENDVKGGLRKL